MLIITADDLGLSRAVTKGVLEAHRRGVVRSAGLLVTYPASPEAAAEARLERDLEVGLHIDLVGGDPISDPATIPSLCDAEGRFFPLSEFTKRLFTARIRASDIAVELRAQVERARSWGTPALAWDSHRHVHLMPPVARVVGGVAKEMGARWVRRGRAYGATLVPKQAALSLATLVSELSLRHVAGNGWFLDVTYVRPRLDAEAVALLAMRGGVGEISSHPGYIDDDLRHADSLVEPREYDLELLTDPLLLEALGRDAVSWRVR
jgi:predicted glycoside hydrolase/deacetylase ChbG (UPF0249 family)